MLKDTLTMRKPIGVDKLTEIASRASSMMQAIRDMMLEPEPRKVAPTVNSSRLMQLCGINRARFQYLVGKGDIPDAPRVGGNKGRVYDLATAQEIVRKIVPDRLRPAGVLGTTVCVGNFKGGVAKTTTAVGLAQGLSLQGHKVCFIDLDPQASATTLFGLVPATEVGEDDTVMPVVYGDQLDLAYAPRPTYWPGIDLIPSAPHLFGADFILPTRQVEDPNFKFYDVLENAMKPLRVKYDVIVIDTPPTLSYLASSAFMASDGMIVPIPPETLDYASSTMFFEQFAEMFSTFKSRGIDKNFDFVKVVLTKVKPKKAKDKTDAADITRGFINQTYPEFAVRTEIPMSDSISNAAAELKTIFDLNSQTGSAKALTSFDQFVEEIGSEIVASWATKIKE